MSKSKNEEIEKKTINGIEWYILTSTEGDNMLSYDYYAYYNNKYYHMGYDDFGSGNLCKESLDVIENSLKCE